MHILSMLDHKSRLKCIYWNAIYLVICVRIDCTHSRSWVAYFTVAVAPPARAAAGSAGSARRWPIIDAVVPMLGQRWTGRSHCLGGEGWLAGGCVWITLSIWTCKISLSLQKLSLSLLFFVTVPCQSTDFFVFKLSPALSALWTQHCSGGKKQQQTNTLLVTILSGTDKYFLL